MLKFCIFSIGFILASSLAEAKLNAFKSEAKLNAFKSEAKLNAFKSPEDLQISSTSAYCRSGLKAFQDIAILWDNSFDEYGYYHSEAEQIAWMIGNELFDDSAYEYYDAEGYGYNRMTQITFIPFPHTRNYDYHALRDYRVINSYDDMNYTLTTQLTESLSDNYPKYSGISE